MNEFNCGGLTFLEHNYRSLKREGYFGVVHKDISDERALKSAELAFKNPGGPLSGIKHEGMFTRRLLERELAGFPPERFVNASNIYGQGLRRTTPIPLALVYRGNALELMSRPDGAYITQLAEGERLLQLIEMLKLEELRTPLVFLRSRLTEARNKHIGMMDFAPRDILVKGEKTVTLCDTENVLYSDDHGKLLEAQIEQFFTDYEPMVGTKAIPDREALEKMARILGLIR